MEIKFEKKFRIITPCISNVLSEKEATEGKFWTLQLCDLLHRSFLEITGDSSLLWNVLDLISNLKSTRNSEFEWNKLPDDARLYYPKDFTNFIVETSNMRRDGNLLTTGAYIGYTLHQRELYSSFHLGIELLQMISILYNHRRKGLAGYLVFSKFHAIIWAIYFFHMGKGARCYDLPSDYIGNFIITLKNTKEIYFPASQDLLEKLKNTSV